MNTTLDTELTQLLNQAGVEIVKFIDITRLPASQSKGFPVAILLGMSLSSGYLEMVAGTPGYVQEMKRTNRIYEDEFHNAELRTDELADFISGYLVAKGFNAYSQSEKNLLATGRYDILSQTTALPHKTIALMADMGWIGKHDLLVTPQYGSAISMCTILTNAPLHVRIHPVSPSQCGDCTVCHDECDGGVIKGKEWKPQVSRDELVDVKACTSCLKCMVLCPWTRRYVKQETAVKNGTYQTNNK